MKTDIYNADHIAKVLKGIQASIPPLLIKNAVYEVPLTPTMAMVVDKALEDPKIDEEKKKQLRLAKANDEFSKKHIVNNPRVQKQINDWISRAINKAIKQGRLPPQSKVKDIDFIKSMYAKVQEK